jgi:hypothetical protein
MRLVFESWSLSQKPNVTVAARGKKLLHFRLHVGGCFKKPICADDVYVLGQPTWHSLTELREVQDWRAIWQSCNGLCLPLLRSGEMGYKSVKTPCPAALIHRLIHCNSQFPSHPIAHILSFSSSPSKYAVSSRLCHSCMSTLISRQSMGQPLDVTRAEDLWFENVETWRRQLDSSARRQGALQNLTPTDINGLYIGPTFATIATSLSSLLARSVFLR